MESRGVRFSREMDFVMALKDLITWFTGNDARDPWPNGGGAPSARGQRRSADDNVTKIAEWQSSNRTKATPDATAEAFFADARREMDHIREAFWTNNDVGSLPSKACDAPGLKLEETSNEYRVTLAFPGFDENDIDIEAHADMLTVCAEKRSEHKESAGNGSTSERLYSRSQRAVPFKTPVDPDKITSTFKSGILSVTLPKKR